MSVLDVLLRFCLGGCVVVVFALFGELFAPKTFGGMFGSAPSVAVATLALAFVQRGTPYVASEAHAMTLGAVGLWAYATVCGASVRARHSVWLTAVAAWVVWGAVAGSLFAMARATGHVD